MTENDNHGLSFDSLPWSVAELHAKIDRLTETLERFISSAGTEPLPEIMTVEDVSAMLCKSVSTIYAMTSERRIPYRKQGNRLYFMRTEIKSWLMDSVVPKDAPKRKRKPQDNGDTDELYMAERVTEAITDGSNTGIVENQSENCTENSLVAPDEGEGNPPYTIEQRTHTKNGTTIFAVLFPNEIEVAGERKFAQTAREFHGYWSDFGNGGYIFNTRQDAENFAKAIRGKERNQGL